jgi:hypothetical protein
MRWKATTCHRIDLPCRFQLAGARDVSDIQSIPIGTTSSNSDSLEMTPEEVNRPCVSSRAALLDGELQQAWETPQQRIVFLLVAKETAHEMRRLPPPPCTIHATRPSPAGWINSLRSLPQARRACERMPVVARQEHHFPGRDLKRSPAIRKCQQKQASMTTR